MDLQSHGSGLVDTNLQYLTLVHLTSGKICRFQGTRSGSRVVHIAYISFQSTYNKECENANG